jgi:hypothetical protein
MKATIRAAGAAVTAAAFLALAVPATAGGPHYNTDVSLSIVGLGMGGYQAQGEVDSPKKACKQKRQVKLYHKDGGADTFIDKDKSNRKGKYAILMGVSPDPGKYYAVAPKKTVSTGKASYTCDQGKSNTAQF